MTDVTIKKLPESQLEISGIVNAVEFDASIAEITKELIKATEIKGFRKGSAPEKLVIETVGESTVLERAAKHALEKVWQTVLKQNSIEAIGQAAFNVLKMARHNDLEWKAQVAVMPEISLPDYKKIASKENSGPEPKIIVEDREIDEVVSFIQKKKTREGKEPPVINDEFARSIGDFPTLDALKENIRVNLVEEKKFKNKEKQRADILEQIAQQTKIEIPSAMIDAECERMITEQKAGLADMGMNWEDYLKHVKKAEGELRKDWRDNAKKRATYALILRDLAHIENIRPSEDEIHAKIEELLRPYTDSDRQRLDRGKIRDYANGVLRNDKVLEFLQNIKS